jgi:hypothetical protein
MSLCDYAAPTGSDHPGLTKNGVLCLPSGTSAILRQVAFAGNPFLSWYSLKVPSTGSSSKYTSSAELRASTTWRLLVVAAMMVRPGGQGHSLTVLSSRTCRKPCGWTWSRPASPICWTAIVGADDRNPVSCTSSIVLPMASTSVPLMKDRMI